MCKETVYCSTYLDGTLQHVQQQNRVVYETKKLGRHIKDGDGKVHILTQNPFNHYRVDIKSVKVMSGNDLRSMILSKVEK